MQGESKVRNIGIEGSMAMSASHCIKEATVTVYKNL